MARSVRQLIPAPPDHYDQQYLSRLVDALNRYMFQRQALGELIAARFIMTDAPSIPDLFPDTTTLATGTLYLDQINGVFATQFEESAGASVTTTSTTFVHMGFAMQFTPVHATRGIFTITGQLSNDTNNQSTYLSLAWGTGTPPAYGAPLAGTLFGQPVTLKAWEAGASVPMAQTAILTGLVPGTTYWIDAVMRVSGGTGTLSAVNATGTGLFDSPGSFFTIVKETDL